MGGVKQESGLYRWVVLVNIWINEVVGPIFNLVHHGRVYGPFGWEGQTISAGLGVIEHINGGTIPWCYPISKAIGSILNFVDKHHNREALNGKN